MKVKIEVKSLNNYSPPHLGRGLIRLTLHPRTISHRCEIVQCDAKYQEFLLSPKINLFGLHRIAWCP